MPSVDAQRNSLPLTGRGSAVASAPSTGLAPSGHPRWGWGGRSCFALVIELGNTLVQVSHKRVERREECGALFGAGRFDKACDGTQRVPVGEALAETDLLEQV